MDSYKLVILRWTTRYTNSYKRLRNNKIKDDNPDADFNIHSLQNTKDFKKIWI